MLKDDNMSITIETPNTTHWVTPHLFNAGELNISLKQVPREVEWYRIRAEIHDSDDLVTLLLVNDALNRHMIVDEYSPPPVRILLLPYLPYSRQDRVCNKGEALSIKVFADLINSMEFDSVITWDAHSDVGPALINNCVNLDVGKLINTTPLGRELIRNPQDWLLIAPDAGAEKKVHEVAKYFGGIPVVGATKVRDTKTGAITETTITDSILDLAHRKFLVVDDICDGGRTFTELAKVLTRVKPAGLYLWVTHGLFSRGLLPLIDAGYNEIHCTNSFPQSTPAKGVYHYHEILK
jgi:ribose-phosphate pyrophosphokinase